MGRGHSSEGPRAGSAWLPKVTAAFHQLQGQRSSSTTERWAQPTSAQPQARQPSETWWQDCTVEILISTCSPQPLQLHVCARGGKPGPGSRSGGAGVWGIERQRGRTPRSLPGPACCSDILAAKGQASGGHRRTPWTSVAPVQRSRPQSGDHAGSNSGRRQHGPESPPNQSSLNREEDVHVTSAI